MVSPERISSLLTDMVDEAMVHSPLHHSVTTTDDETETDHTSELEAPLLTPEERSSSICLDDEQQILDENIPTLPKSWVGPLLLLFVSFLFATLNVSLRSLYLMADPPTPAALSATRGWMTMFMFVPVVCHRRYCSAQRPREALLLDTYHKPMWRVAGELAIWNFLGQALYNWGILYVSSARASFLGQTSVVMVPFICAMAGETLRWWDGLGCLCSLLGLILLSVQDNPDEDEDEPGNPQLSLGFGDILILSSAFCWSFYIIKTSKHAHAFDEVYLQGAKNGVLVVLYSIWILIAWLCAEDSLWDGWYSGAAWAILTYSAFGPGILADLLQQKGQEAAGPTTANLVLCIESVFTAILGRLLLGEETSWIEKLGGAFLIVGAVVSGQSS